MTTHRSGPFLVASLSIALLAGCAESLSTTDTPDLEDDQAPLIQDVELIPNPNNTLSTWIRWQTDVPATSVVEFGLDDELMYWLGDEDTLTTEHEVLVIGMRTGSPYRLAAVSAGASGLESRSEELTYVAGPLPFEGLEPSLTVLDEDLRQPGWTLANVVAGGVISPVLVVMVDEEGFVVWYYELEEEGRADVEATLVDDGSRVLIGGGMAPGRPVEIDLAGGVVWEGPLLSSDEFGAEGGHHHTFRKLPNGNYLTMEWSYDGGLHDAIVEADADWNTVWRWDSPIHVGSDYAWGNSALVDLDEDVAYYGVADESLLYKVDRTDGQILWTLGDGGDFEAVALREDSEPWFVRAHSPKLLDNGHILFHDNGDHQREYSRVVEYVIDEQTMEARMVWEYPGALADDYWYNRQWGDADRLDNGNTLVTAGSVVGSSSPSHLFEVTPDGTKVWELYMGEGAEGDLFGTYKAERIPELVNRL